MCSNGHDIYSGTVCVINKKYICITIPETFRRIDPVDIATVCTIK